MEKIKKTYENGLRVVFEKSEKNVVGLNILFFVGSQNENKNEEGYAHFIEHMVFKGTEKRDTNALADELTMLGADFNASTSRTVTRFTIKCLKENFEKCFEIYSDMLLNASLNDEDMNKEREVVIEEMKRYADDPVEVLYSRVMENYFGDNPYAHDTLGSEEIIKNVSRKELLKFKEKFYVPQNCVISVVGNMEFEELENLIEKYFVFKNSTKNEPKLADFEKFKIKIKKKYDIVKRNDNQANICVHIKSITCDNKLKSVAEIYNCILGNMQNSRLYKRIREELGLVYTIYAIGLMGTKTGEIFIMFGTRPENTANALVEIRKILKDLADNGITEKELVMAKNLKKSSLEYSMETNSDIAELNGTYINVFDKLYSPEEKIKELEKVSILDVNKFAKMVYNQKTFNVVAVGKGIKKKDIQCFVNKNTK